MADGKKISFSFNKFTKKPNLGFSSCSTQRKRELIECVESQTIKIKNVLKEIYTPRVIPMPESSSTPLQRKRNRVENEEVDSRPDSELTPDELAARELIKESQNSTSVSEHKSTLILPATSENSEIVEDKDESTLDDYENVPINEYGLAMLRGMGWKEGTGIGKTSSITKVKEPNLRPKGMGLGANIARDTKVCETNGEELVLKKGCYAKIIDGKQKGQYCEVQGFDDEAGRIIVKTSLQGLILALNEFLIVPVTREEYTKSSKVINIAKYEEYKHKEPDHLTSSQSSNKIYGNDDLHKINAGAPKSTNTKDKCNHKNSYDSHYQSTTAKKHQTTKYNESSDSEDEYIRKRNGRNKHRR